MEGRVIRVVWGMVKGRTGGIEGKGRGKDRVELG